MRPVIRLADAAISTPSTPDPLLIDAAAFAAMLSVSKATFARMKSARRLPCHIELSAGCHRWNAVEVRDWIDAGCPPVREWETRQLAKKARHH